MSSIDKEMRHASKKRKCEGSGSIATDAIVLSDDEDDISDSQIVLTDEDEISDSQIVLADGLLKNTCPSTTQTSATQTSTTQTSTTQTSTTQTSTTPTSTTQTSSAQTSSSTTKELTVLSWNIDGLDEQAIELRAMAVFESIHKCSPDVVMLQEVVDKNLNVLKQLCVNYSSTVHKLDNYYNIIMVKKAKNITQTNHEWIEFENSGMGRFLLFQHLKVNETPFLMLTTHLESLPKYSNERKEQLRECFNTIKKHAAKSNVILCGDLNIRENEIKSLGGPPQGVFDAWEALGSDAGNRFTWDLQLNDNKKFDNGVKPRARYDRMYYSSLKAHGIKCTSFKLIGKERIETCKLFPSDHFGVLVKFSVL